MRIRRNDNDGDWTFGHSLTDYCIDNSQGIAQRIKTRILEWLNDCFFNQTAGIDYRTRMGQRNQRALLDEDIRKIITETEGVLALVEYQSSLYERSLIVDFKVYHIYSELPYATSITLQGVQYV